MKLTSKHFRQPALLITSLLLFITLTGLSLPIRASLLQEAATSTPTPTPTVLYVNGEPVLQSGDTEGLILWAGIILLLILAGVLIQRILLKKNTQE